jgi:hypothetical protein
MAQCALAGHIRLAAAHGAVHVEVRSSLGVYALSLTAISAAILFLIFASCPRRHLSFLRGPRRLRAPLPLFRIAALRPSRRPPHAAPGDTRDGARQTRRGACGRGAARAESVHEARVRRGQERARPRGARPPCGASSRFRAKIVLTDRANQAYAASLSTLSAFLPPSTRLHLHTRATAILLALLGRAWTETSGRSSHSHCTRRKRARALICVRIHAVCARWRRRAAAPAVRVCSGGSWGASRAASVASLLSVGAQDPQAEVIPEQVSICAPPASAYPFPCALLTASRRWLDILTPDIHIRLSPHRARRTSRRQRTWTGT